MTFPPANYDAAVLISLGPDGNTRGLLPEPGGLPAAVTNGVAPAYAYHVLGIVAYFMASRDADASGALDFDFRGRTRGGEAKNPNNQLPDPLAPNGQGPMILVIE